MLSVPSAWRMLSVPRLFYVAVMKDQEREKQTNLGFPTFSLNVGIDPVKQQDSFRKTSYSSSCFLVALEKKNLVFFLN